MRKAQEWWLGPPAHMEGFGTSRVYGTDPPRRSGCRNVLSHQELRLQHSLPRAGVIQEHQLWASSFTLPASSAWIPAGSALGSWAAKPGRDSGCPRSTRPSPALAEIWVRGQGWTLPGTWSQTAPGAAQLLASQLHALSGTCMSSVVKWGKKQSFLMTVLRI